MDGSRPLHLIEKTPLGWYIWPWSPREGRVLRTTDALAGPFSTCIAALRHASALALETARGA